MLLSDRKKLILRGRNYVYLNGRWRHKGAGPSLSDFAVRILDDADFGDSMDRYASALSRSVHQIHYGRELFTHEG